ncbi:hypothetical protein HD553DRAFT_342223 [Filobasidium floriforme]|uniref:uncharacterized protein n=1 Tax=Filobasidium floriforme TaxID=5210 RepID=UPI001E8D91BF|nr:uncharacterized protein HD553DRAFT_342223 [Filobasidium floriforme]KAH8084725.1 hypothetical protein HD553DRAFT_342223 [Filobasidium floriforme]
MSVAKRLSTFRTAVLHQAAPPPAIGGIVKPPKPNGYRDSAADIAYCLRAAGETVVTPNSPADPHNDPDWSYPDTEKGILAAVQTGANVLWCNTTLWSDHPIVRLGTELARLGVRFVAQDPLDTEKYDDKAWTNNWLNQGELEGKFPKSWLIEKGDTEGQLREVTLPAVLKPIRGRGSHGVELVTDADGLGRVFQKLWEESEAVLVEEYLAGEEITIAVMPPGEYEDVGTKTKHWALPVVQRFDHVDGIAPYNGIVPVTANSRVLTPLEHEQDHHYTDVQRWVEIVGDRLGSYAPIRIDCRRRSSKQDGGGGPFYLFDVNLKPNATGPGRPGRDDQASLVLMAAQAIGWDFTKLARNMLAQAQLVKGGNDTEKSSAGA